MQDSQLRNLSLLSWTMQIWNDHRRGLPQAGHAGPIAYCLQYHQEWWKDWELAEHLGDPSIASRLIHIHNDAAIKTQLERGSPPEIKALYDSLREKGFREFECIHTLALALVEENEHVRVTSDIFVIDRYIERANRYVKEALARPNLTRLAKAKVY